MSLPPAFMAAVDRRVDEAAARLAGGMRDNAGGRFEVAADAAENGRAVVRSDSPGALEADLGTPEQPGDSWAVRAAWMLPGVAR